MAPDSWTAMCPEEAAMTPSYGFSRNLMTVVLVWVPPVKKNTSAFGRAMAERMRCLAFSV